ASSGRAQRFRQPALAETLESIVTCGPDAFYTGPTAGSLTRHLSERGGVLSLDDMATQRAEPVAPIQINYRGRQVLSQPPVSLGCLLLQELRILNEFEVKHLEPGSAELVDLLVQCKQAAFADASSLGDPDETDNRLVWRLSDERAAYWRTHIDSRSPRHPQP